MTLKLTDEVEQEFGRWLVRQKGPEERNITSLRRPDSAQCQYQKKGGGAQAETET